jgi:hypothetical protein
MDTIKSPISRIFDGKFRMTSQDDTVKVESWRTLQLDTQVRLLSIFLSPSTRLDVLVTYLQILPTARFSIHGSRRTRPHLTAKI